MAEDEEEGEKRLDFPTSNADFVVVIAGSAGSLEVFTYFVENIPIDTGATYIVLSHFDPNTSSSLTEILQKKSKMPVSRVENDQIMKENHIYVQPEDKYLSFKNGSIIVHNRGDNEDEYFPIDKQLKSLAKEKKRKAIVVITSGMGSDGSRGVQAIKKHGGRSIAQSLNSSKYPSMPKKAIETGHIDIIASKDQIIEAVLDLLNKGRTGEEVPLYYVPPLNIVHKILNCVKESKQQDFLSYRSSTVFRRIEKRMMTQDLKNMKEYYEYLQENPSEIEALYNALLIGVTSFFRDPDVFKKLKSYFHSISLEEIPKKMRIWVAGCSTGEEAYSLAIIIHEFLEERDLLDEYSYQMFATDLDEKAIEKARKGEYSKNAAEHISKQRLKVHFVQVRQKYRIKSHIRKHVIFAQQNIFQEPPFTKIDLLSCRNVLIYLSRNAQKQILSIFHYSLNPGGILVLGNSESIETKRRLFQIVDKRSKIFRKSKEIEPTNHFLNISSSFMKMTESHHRQSKQDSSDNTDYDAVEQFKEKLLNQYSPPSLMINKSGDILYITGKTKDYLEVAPGKPRMNLFNMLRDDFKYQVLEEIAGLFEAADTTQIREIDISTKKRRLKIILDLVQDEKEAEQFAMVIFQEGKTIRTVEKPTAEKRNKEIEKGSLHSTEVRELKRELRFTKKELQSVKREMQKSKQDLRKTNEQLQATNEELQSTNEELKSSKEEMQSLNEELITLNEELEAKVHRLSELNNDMRNLLNSIDVAIIFLDSDLKIKRYTPQATEIFHFRKADLGRPLEELKNFVDYDDLISDAKEVLESLIPKEFVLSTKEEDKKYQLRIMPYRTSDNKINGIVMRFNPLNQ